MRDCEGCGRRVYHVYDMIARPFYDERYLCSDCLLKASKRAVVCCAGCGMTLDSDEIYTDGDTYYCEECLLEQFPMKE